MTREEFERRATVHLIVHPSDVPVRGNALSSGNVLHDRRYEDAILRMLEEGNEFAWFDAEVYASIYLTDGTELRGESDYLGACSYASEADFRAPGGYFDDMRATALDNLWDLVQRIKEL